MSLVYTVKIVITKARCGQGSLQVIHRDQHVDYAPNSISRHGVFLALNLTVIIKDCAKKKIIGMRLPPPKWLDIAPMSIAIQVCDKHH
jgi:hypothetical protein